MLNNHFFRSNSLRHSPVVLRPLYYYALLKYPKENPILLAADEDSLHFIRRLKGTCLFCPKNVDAYDLSFCFQHEVWILYAKKIYFTKAMQLAQAMQQNGASKILAIWINATPAKEYRYGRC